MHWGKERTVIMKNGDSFTGKKVFNFFEGFREQTYDVTEDSSNYKKGQRIKTAAFSISHIIYKYKQNK